MSGGDDGRVYIWDNSRCGEEQGRADYEDGPPELVFHHMTHNSMIEDAQWAPMGSLYEPGVFPVVASLENSDMVQIWKASDEFFDKEIEKLNCVANIPEDALE